MVHRLDTSTADAALSLTRFHGILIPLPIRPIFLYSHCIALGLLVSTVVFNRGQPSFTAFAIGHASPSPSHLAVLCPTRTRSAQQVFEVTTRYVDLQPVGMGEWNAVTGIEERGDRRPALGDSSEACGGSPMEMPLLGRRHAVCCTGTARPAGCSSTAGMTGCIVVLHTMYSGGEADACNSCPDRRFWSGVVRRLRQALGVAG